MKAGRPQVERALDRPEDARFFLLHGPDEAGSRALLKRLAAAMGEGAERIDLSGADLKADPARLADEAAAISMFGDRRWVLVEQAGDESEPALAALIEAAAAGNPVAIVAGALKSGSKLLKTALAARSGLAFASYPPDAGQAERLVLELARGHGLAARPDVARRIAEAAGGNCAIVDQELAKLALYLDASPGAPRPLDHEALDAVGAGAEGDLSRLVDSVAGGDGAALEAEIARLKAEGKEGITLTRAVLRRMALLARLRAEVERGNSAAAVMKSPAGKAVFFKEQDAVGRQIARWRPALIAKAVSRLIEAERQVMAPGGPGIVAAEEELFAICRQAARLR